MDTSVKGRVSLSLTLLFKLNWDPSELEDEHFSGFLEKPKSMHPGSKRGFTSLCAEQKSLSGGLHRKDPCASCVSSRMHHQVHSWKLHLKGSQRLWARWPLALLLKYSYSEISSHQRTKKLFEKLMVCVWWWWRGYLWLLAQGCIKNHLYTVWPWPGRETAGKVLEYVGRHGKTLKRSVYGEYVR